MVSTLYGNSEISVRITVQALSPLLFATVMEAISKAFWVGFLVNCYMQTIWW